MKKFINEMKKLINEKGYEIVFGVSLSLFTFSVLTLVL